MKGWRWLEFDYDDGYQVYIIFWLYDVYEDYEDDSDLYRIYCHEDETYITYIGFMVMMSKIAPKKGWGSRHQMVESMSAATVQVISERPTSFRGARRCSLSCRSATTHRHTCLVPLILSRCGDHFGDLEHDFYDFPYWECHHPNWRTDIFQRGRAGIPPTSHSFCHDVSNITMENHHFLWVNPLFLWPFSIANC